MKEEQKSSEKEQQKAHTHIRPDGTVYEHVHVHQRENEKPHSHSHTHTHENTKAVLNRLSRAIGHLESIKKMVESLSLIHIYVVVLNFARDLLVDEDAMIKALEEGKVRRYVTDFPNHTTAAAKGTIVIPHLGASTEESEDNCAMMAVQELRDYMENGNINHSVNYPTCDMGECSHCLLYTSRCV